MSVNIKNEMMRQCNNQFFCMAASLLVCYFTVIEQIDEYLGWRADSVVRWMVGIFHPFSDKQINEQTTDATRIIQ